MLEDGDEDEEDADVGDGGDDEHHDPSFVPPANVDDGDDSEEEEAEKKKQQKKRKRQEKDGENKNERKSVMEVHTPRFRYVLFRSFAFAIVLSLVSHLLCFSALGAFGQTLVCFCLFV